MGVGGGKLTGSVTYTRMAIIHYPRLLILAKPPSAYNMSGVGMVGEVTMVISLNTSCRARHHWWLGWWVELSWNFNLTVECGCTSRDAPLP